MRATYRVLAYLVPVLVAVQAAAIAFAFFGVGNWVDDGNKLTKAVMDGNGSVTGDAGLMIHAIGGQMVIPLVALLLFVVSFFAKIPGGVRWAGLVLGDVVLQVALAFVAFGVPVIGMLHGLNAFVLFGLGMMAGQQATRAIAAEPATASASQTA